MADPKDTSKPSQEATKSSFANLKTFKVSSTFVVAERLDLGQVSRGYSMCIGYGMPAGDPSIKVVKSIGKS